MCLHVSVCMCDMKRAVERAQEKGREGAR
jgi:hypothetical protein